MLKCLYILGKLEKMCINYVAEDPSFIFLFSLKTIIMPKDICMVSKKKPNQLMFACKPCSFSFHPLLFLLFSHERSVPHLYGFCSCCAVTFFFGSHKSIETSGAGLFDRVLAVMFLTETFTCGHLLFTPFLSLSVSLSLCPAFSLLI